MLPRHFSSHFPRRFLVLFVVLSRRKCREGCARNSPEARHCRHKLCRVRDDDVIGLDKRRAGLLNNDFDQKKNNFPPRQGYKASIGLICLKIYLFAGSFKPILEMLLVK